MWLVTVFGFYSVVQRPGEDVLTVRARVRADLDALRERYMPQLSETIETPQADYGYRATLGSEDFAEGVKKIALDIDYGNFKSEVAARCGWERERIYAGVWSTLLALKKLDKRR